MKVLVGLGNPGKKYEGTRHNIGFELLAEMTRRWSAPRPKVKFDALLAEVQVGGERLLLVAPQTYMNASGHAVRQVLDFYRLATTDFLIACDDMNLPLGKIRLRSGGSSGGQKGLQNILQHLKTEEVARLRIGVGRPPGEKTAVDFVLEPFHKSESDAVDAVLISAANAVECWIKEGMAAAMNRFNAEPKPPA